MTPEWDPDSSPRPQVLVQCHSLSPLITEVPPLGHPLISPLWPCTCCQIFALWHLLVLPVLPSQPLRCLLYVLYHQLVTLIIISLLISRLPCQSARAGSTPVSMASSWLVPSAMPGTQHVCHEDLKNKLIQKHNFRQSTLCPALPTDS